MKIIYKRVIGNAEFFYHYPMLCSVFTTPKDNADFTYFPKLFIVILYYEVSFPNANMCFSVKYKININFMNFFPC